MSSSVLSKRLEEDISPRSFSTRELDEVISLSDTGSFEDKAHWPQEEDIKSIRSSHAEEKSILFSAMASDPKSNFDAAEAAADALGKDLEAMGYDLQCRSFIKKRNDSSSLSHKGGRSRDGERYSSPERDAPFSDHDVVQTLRSSSDLIEATRSNSDVVAALRSMSSEEQTSVEGSGSILSQGTGPRRLPSLSRGPSVRSQRSLVNAVSMKSYLSQNSKSSRRSGGSLHAPPLHPRSNEEDEVIVETVTSLQSHRTKQTDAASKQSCIAPSPNTLELADYHHSPEPTEDIPVDDTKENKSVKEEKVPVTAANLWSRSKKESKKQSKNMETATYHLASGVHLLGQSSSSKEDSEPRIFKCPSEGCKPKSSKYSKFRRPPRNPTRSQAGKSRGSIWSKSAKLLPGKSSMNDNDDVSEVSSIASSRIAPPFPVISIPMKKVVRDNNEGRPPRIPSSSSQKSKEASITQAPDTIHAIERTGSVESRTLEMTDEGLETESHEKKETVVEGENHVLKESRSMTSKSSVKMIQKTESKQSKASSKQSRKSNKKDQQQQTESLVGTHETIAAPTECKDVAVQVESSFPSMEGKPMVEETMEETSNITIEEDDEDKAKEQEIIARKLILENIAESNRRFQRSVQARKQLLTLVRQKENPQDEQLEQRTLPPTFMPDSKTVRSLATAPAQMDGNLPVSTHKSDLKIVNLVESNAETKPNDPKAVGKAVEATDATPKIRGGSRLFGFLSTSPERRRRETKDVIKPEPVQETMKILKLSRRGSKKPMKPTIEVHERTNETNATTEAPKEIKPEIERRFIAPKVKTQSRSSRFPFMKKSSKKVMSPLASPKRPITPKKKEKKLSILHSPKVTLIEQEDALEAIEVEAFEKFDGVEAFITPTMLGANMILEKIVEEGSNDDLLERQSTDKSSTAGKNHAYPPVYDNSSPLILSPIHESPDLEIVLSDKGENLPSITPDVALQDLKKVGADMIASSGASVITKEPPVVLKEQESPTKPKVSFFSAVDKWFFGPISTKPSVEKEQSVEMVDKATLPELVDTTLPAVNGLAKGSEITNKVLSGFELSTTNLDDAVSPTYTTINVEEEKEEEKKHEEAVAVAKPILRTATSLITGPVLPLSRTSPLSKDREQTMAYLDEELKQQEEESSLKSVDFGDLPLDEKKDTSIPTHLILNRSQVGTEFDEGSCLTSLHSCSVSRGLPSTRKHWRGKLVGADDVSAAYSLDMWGEIAEASAVVHRALKNIETQHGGRTPSSDLLTAIEINDEVEEALLVLSKHAARLGVSESDILKAMISRDESDGGESLFQDPSILATELRQSQPRPTHDFDEDDTVKGDGDTATVDGTENSMTIGEEILEAIKMYMAKK